MCIRDRSALDEDLAYSTTQAFLSHLANTTSAANVYIVTGIKSRKRYDQTLEVLLPIMDRLRIPRGNLAITATSNERPLAEIANLLTHNTKALAYASLL